MKEYNGIYAPQIKRFINFKRSLGYKFGIEEYTLLMFDRFTIKENQEVVGLTKELSNKWSQKRPNESDTTRYKRIAIVAQLSAFLCEIGFTSYISRLPKQKSIYTPYIFSSNEIESIFCSCDSIQLRCKKFNTSFCMIPAFFRLLYGTGIRLSEGLLLKEREMHLEDSYSLLSGENSQSSIVARRSGVSGIFSCFSSCPSPLR